jgi:thiol-disulfide isomerase/thioredoxin
VLFGCGKGSETGKKPESAASPASAASVEIPIVSQATLRETLAKEKGKVIVLNFWATWCGPCVEEMPHFAELAKKYADKDVLFLAVSFDDLDTLETAVRPFVVQHDYPFRFFIKEDTRGEAYEAFINAVNPEWGGGVPATFLYDRTGAQRTAFYEAQTAESLEAALQPLL